MCKEISSFFALLSYSVCIFVYFPPVPFSLSPFSVSFAWRHMNIAQNYHYRYRTMENISHYIACYVSPRPVSFLSGNECTIHAGFYNYRRYSATYMLLNLLGTSSNYVVCECRETSTKRKWLLYIWCTRYYSILSYNIVLVTLSWLVNR